MAKGTFFEETLFNFGTVNLGDKIHFKFELKEGVDPSQIEFVYPDCAHCTQWKREGNSIVGTVDTLKIGIDLKGNNQTTRYVFVKPKNGQSTYIGKEDGSWQRVANKNMGLERLQIFGVVVN